MTWHDALDRHLTAAARLLAEHSPATAVVDERDGVVVTACGAAGPSFNPGWVVAPPADPDATIRWAYDTLAATGRPFCLHVPDDLSPAVAPALAGTGLVPEAMPAMAMVTPESVPAPPEWLRVERVGDPAELERHAIAMAVGFGAPNPRGALDVLVPSLLDDPATTMLNGYVDGADEPAATALCVVAEGLGGIYAVTVHEHARRRGAGAAITWAAVAAAARAGVPYVVLQASRMGEPVYSRMGFETVRGYHRYDPR
ncbi:MAG TPA: GNAT family N-acetyltransferase [Frankiaceae bacterium]|jgi:GNAT superfamily N-acetyltransferase|nr:GNAT family N-acetyltransferase [Frankiaceae bacterium]